MQVALAEAITARIAARGYGGSAQAAARPPAAALTGRSTKNSHRRCRENRKLRQQGRERQYTSTSTNTSRSTIGMPAAKIVSSIFLSSTLPPTTKPRPCNNRED